MALKYTPKETLVAKIGTKEIEFTPWTTKNEREYLQLLEKEDVVLDDKALQDILIKPNVKDKNIVLSSSELKLLLIQIRKESIGETFKDEHKCEHCGEISSLEVKLDDVVSYKPTSWTPIVVEDMTFTLGDIRTNKEKEKLSLDKGVIDYVFTDFMLHIQSIEINGELNTEFEFKELKKFMDSLPTKIFDKVFEAYQEQIDETKTELKWVCPNCSKESIIDYDNIPGFLWA